MAQVPEDVSPEQFAEMIRGASDEQIALTVHQTGTKEVLDRTFQGMQEAFDPDKGKGIEAVIQWVVIDGTEEHRTRSRSPAAPARSPRDAPTRHGSR